MQVVFSHTQKKKKGTKDLDNKNLYEKSKHKAHYILLECEKGAEEIKTFFAKRF